MKTKINVPDLIEDMIEYQKKNNVKADCLANASVLYDIMRMYGMEAKITAVYVIGFSGETVYCMGGHVVVESNGILYEPSYDVAKLCNKKYFKRYKEFVDCLKEIPVYISQEILKQALRDNFRFCDHATKINTTSKLLVANEDSYNKQADYILSKKRKR